MKIFFSSKKLKDELTSPAKCKMVMGVAMAKKIVLRLQQAYVATSLEDLRHAPGRWHELHENRKGQFGVSLVEPHRMVFKPFGDHADYLEGHSISWKKVIAIEILEIVNYHDPKK